MKKTIALLCGGKSGEHEVSLRSAKSIFDAIDRNRFETRLVGIDKAGVWRLAPQALKAFSAVEPAWTAVLPAAAKGKASLRDPETGTEQAKIDVFFPITHGTYGEDGSLQGMLRMLDVPFVGAGVLGSAIGMDKDVMKRLLRQAEIPVPRSVTIRARDREEVSYDVLAKQLGPLLFVKPCNLGSSVGIHRVEDAAGFDAALADAFDYDNKVIIEEAIIGREIECSVLGNDQPKASLPGEIIVKKGFYSYEAKYINAEGSSLAIPADMPEETQAALQEMAVKTFEILECCGLARVDFFLLEGGEIMVNEINTLPGFTSISMFPKLWEASGVPCGSLITELIHLAEQKHREETRLKRSCQ